MVATVENSFAFLLRAFYMIQLPYIDKSVWVWYKDGLITFYTSNYLLHFTEYEHNKELTQR